MFVRSLECTYPTKDDLWRDPELPSMVFCYACTFTNRTHRYTNKSTKTPDLFIREWGVCQMHEYQEMTSMTYNGVTLSVCDATSGARNRPFYLDPKHIPDAPGLMICSGITNREYRYMFRMEKRILDHSAYISREKYETPVLYYTVCITIPNAQDGEDDTIINWPYRYSAGSLYNISGITEGTKRYYLKIQQ